MGLNQNHRRVLLATLRHVDDLLAQVEAAAADTRSPFSQTIQDLSPPERRVVVEHVATIRARMADGLRALGIPPPRAGVNASWAIRTSLALAGVALADAAPSRLQGYGPLDDAAATEVDAIEADLDRSLQRLEAWLSRGAARDLGTRLKRLSDVPLDLDLLRTVEEIVSARGLVEFQGALEAIVERLETGTVEVAFFGRVSSGKTSLLNVILAEALLPVGVTPVTAVPTRIEFGATAGATIRFVDAPDQEISPGRLSEFVAERSNPGNAKHVLRATARIPSARLRGGLVLVDTPGVGALATAGARQSYHYLPRCDLGVVLVDAAGSLSVEDVDLLRLLLESGIEPMVLISKIDLVDGSERPVLRDYVRAEIVRQLAAEVPVHLVSVMPPDAVLASRWFESELAPWADHARTKGLAAAGRKIEAVREGVVALLRSALERSNEGVGGEAGPGRADAVARDAEVALREAEVHLPLVVDDARAIGDAVIARSAADAAHRRRDPSLRLGTVVREVLLDAARRVRVRTLDELTGARDRLRGALEALPADRDRPQPPVEVVSVDLLGLPEIVVPEFLDDLESHAPRWIRRFGVLLEGRLARHIRAHAGEAINEAAREFGRRLSEWSRGALARLAEQFAAQAEPLRAPARTRIENPEAVRADLARIETHVDPVSSRAARGGERIGG